MEVKSNHVFVTVHSVHSNVAKIHSKLPAAMEFCHLPVYFYES